MAKKMKVEWTFTNGEDRRRPKSARGAPHLRVGGKGGEYWEYCIIARGFGPMGRGYWTWLDPHDVSGTVSRYWTLPVLEPWLGVLFLLGGRVEIGGFMRRHKYT